jgi:hypothetical protein
LLNDKAAAERRVQYVFMKRRSCSLVQGREMHVNELIINSFVASGWARHRCHCHITGKSNKVMPSYDDMQHENNLIAE